MHKLNTDPFGQLAVSFVGRTPQIANVKLYILQGLEGDTAGNITDESLSLRGHNRPASTGPGATQIKVAPAVYLFCFWINLPFGGLAIAMLFFSLRMPAQQPTRLTFREKVTRMDLGGTILFISSMVCLFLALQWGGLEYPWSSSRVWGLILGFGLLIIAFVALQLHLGNDATIPPHIFRQKSVVFILLSSIFISIGVNVHTFYLPFYFQSAKGLTAAASGIRLLPYLLSITIVQVVVGIGVAMLGVYLPFMWSGAAIFAVAAGLMYTLNVTTGTARIIGYQILAGVGFGSSLQLCATAMRASVGKMDIPIASALSVFAPFFGGALAASIAQNVFRSTLTRYLLHSVLSSQAAEIVAAGATGGVNLVNDSQKGIVQEAYNYAVTRTFILSVGAAGIGFLCTLGIEWKNIKKSQSPPVENSREKVETPKNGTRMEKNTSETEATSEILNIGSKTNKA